MAFLLSFASYITERLASTSFGQYVIKKFDSVLWVLERPAKYCVHGKSDSPDVSWLLFWTILIYMQIFRVVISIILIQFNKNPIEPNDVVVFLQKWRRSLRSVRYRGLRKMRESRGGDQKLNGNSGSSHPIQPCKKRNHNEMLDHNVIEDLMNRTFSDNDDADSTFTMSRTEEANMSSTQGSHSEDYLSPSKPKEITEEVEMTEDGSTSSLNENNRTKLERNGKLSIGSDQNVSSKSASQSNKKENGLHGKESLNQPLDAADDLMSKLVENGGAVNNRVYGKYQKNKKKNWKGLSDDKLTGNNRQQPTKNHKK